MNCAFALLIIASLDDQQPKQDSSMVDTVFWANSIIREIRTYDKGVYNYDLCSWHANGAMHRIGRVNDGDTLVYHSWDSTGRHLVTDGKGPYVEYLEDGSLARTGSYRDSLPDGTWTYYHRNGQPSARGNYEGDRWSRQPRGEWTRWYENGHVHSKGLLPSWTETGPWTFYHPNGRISHTREGADYTNRGRYAQAFDSSGAPTIQNGQGYFLEHYPNGRCSVRYHVTDFHKDTVLRFHPNGLLKERMVHMQDTARNIWWYSGIMLDAWDPTGKQTLVNGSGYRWTKHQWANARVREHYSDGVLDGESAEFDHAGRLRELNCYDRGDWFGDVLYYNNGRRSTELDVLGEPLRSKVERIFWWYNGRLRSYDNLDSVVLYHPNGKVRAVGYYPADSTAATYPNNTYMLLGHTLGGNASDDSLWMERLDGTGMVVSYSYSTHSVPDDWQRTYYPNGQLATQVKRMDSCACLIRTEFYPSGALHWAGRMFHGRLALDHRRHGDDSYFIGYHRAGLWTEFSEDRQVIEMVDFDNREPKERWIENYPSPDE